MPEITLVMGDGWNALYVDGDRKLFGDDFGITDVLGALGIEHTVREEAEYLDTHMEFPERLEDLG